MKYNWLYVAIAAALVGLALLLWETPPQALLPDRGEDDEGQPLPYAIIENAHSRHFDNSGQLSYEFVARTLYYFRHDLTQVSEEDFTTLDEPQLTLFTGDKRWYVTADRGRLSDSGRVLTLWDNVRVWRPEDGGGEINLNTSKLVVLPQAKLVNTDAPVRIESPQGALEAIGMSVDLNSQKIELKQSVRGYHEPI